MPPLKNSMESYNNRLDQAEERINELADTSIEIFQRRKKKRMKKNEESLWDLKTLLKETKGIPAGKNGEKGMILFGSGHCGPQHQQLCSN